MIDQNGVNGLTKLETDLLIPSETIHPDNSKRQKILILTWEFPPNVIGGLARHCHGLARSLVKANYEVHVLTTKLSTTPNFEIVDGIKVFRITPLHEQEANFLTWIAGLNLAMIDKVKELAREHQYGLIHAHDWLVGTAGILLKSELSIPLITTIHSLEQGRNDGIYTETQKFIDDKERQLIHGSDQIIVCSEFMKDALLQQFSAKEDRLSVIANGIDPDSAEINELTILSKNIPLNSNKRLIFSIGRLVKEKGFDVLIEAAPELLKQYPDLYFIIAGKGPMENEYQRLIRDRGLENIVFLIGYVDDSNRNLLFNQCEIAIFPSLYEPFGIVTLEAMIFGKPTIVSNTGGLKGIIDHGNTGLLMNPGDKRSLVKQVQEILDNPPKAKQLGENGKKIVQQLFSWKRIGLETKRVYEETIMKSKYFQS
ncbi:glycosyltransferase family 4 protein [Bacillus sp. DNRA2]|uniref:glycosyltransferase family 4 protein n=1 Tax=Bacillus sp. DNRA2 TaxID=2723053 RepID=UPI00145CBB3C|nr:glycosyltransferase family 4 protein [Bacillus sp. DNRA2]NMD71852.1 glycosyltransferase family 4 protein [Bacillus sp. DNRA2]